MRETADAVFLLECWYMKVIIGVDEAGRGPLAGPVSVGVVAAKNKKFSKELKGIRDSKKFSESQREEWFKKIKKLKREGIVDYAVSLCGAKVINERGIVGAIKLALARSLKKLECPPNKCEILLDGSLYAPAVYKKQKTIIGGDDEIPLISAASIMAKVTRDRKMGRLAKKFPGYGFEIHKGYGTAKHIKAIKKLGATEEHRKLFIRNFIR